MITIYHLSTSRSERIIWLMEELGLPYGLERLAREPNLAAPAELKAVHPLGRAPVVRDGDVVLAESSAIVDYVTRRHAGGRLSVGPDEPGFADYLFWLHFAESSLAGQLLREWTVDLLVHDLEDSPVVRRLRETTRTQLAFVNERLARSPHVAGEAFTAADIMMAFPFTTMQAFRTLDLEPYPHIRAYVSRIAAPPGLCQGDGDRRRHRGLTMDIPGASSLRPAGEMVADRPGEGSSQRGHRPSPPPLSRTLAPQAGRRG